MTWMSTWQEVFRQGNSLEVNFVLGNLTSLDKKLNLQFEHLFHSLSLSLSSSIYNIIQIRNNII